MGLNPLNLGADAAVGVKLGILALVLGAEAQSVIDTYVKTGRLELDLVPPWLADALAGPLANAEETIGQPLFELLIRAPSGVNLSKEPGHQEADAVRMVERMFGFAFALPWGVAQLKEALEAAMGHNAPKAVIEALEKLPEDLGINWALGTTMANIFELATGRPLAEAINEQTRPFRLEWPQVRALLKQGHLSEGEAIERFAKIGIRDEDVPLMLKLDRILLSLGDLQQAYLFGLMSEPEVRDYLALSGLDPRDVDVLVSIYLTRAQTTGAGELRSVAQTGYLEDHLSEPQYRALLLEANVPQASIDLEVEAANLTKHWGRQRLTVAEIKTQYQAGRMDAHAALQRLLVVGYTEEDAQLIIDSWREVAKAGKLGLSEARVLSYLLGGVIDRSQAIGALVQQGYKTDDAAFLVDNPASFGGVYRYPLTPATVLAALKDFDIDAAQATKLLLELNVEPNAAALEVKIAQQLGRRAQKPKAPAKALTEGQVLGALGLKLVEPSWALSELSLLGYSDADAALLVVSELTRRDGEVPQGWLPLS